MAEENSTQRELGHLRQAIENLRAGVQEFHDDSVSVKRFERHEDSDNERNKETLDRLSNIEKVLAVLLAKIGACVAGITVFLQIAGWLIANVFKGGKP